MLAFFPALHPDEMLYSACARYHRRSGNLSIKATMKDLFGSTTASAVVDLPNRLDCLRRQLPAGTLTTVDRLIKENTLLPLYSPFLPRNRVDRIIAWMQGSTHGGGIHMAMGIMASGVPVPRHLRFCPECLAADESRYGEPYWHRSHQAAGALLCHKHEVWLCESDVPTAAPQNKHAFVAAPVPNGKYLPQPYERYFLHCREIARSVAWLLSHPETESPGLFSLRKKYLHHLRQMDLASYSGRVAQRELLERFTAHYGDCFLEQIHCRIDIDSQDNWLNSIVRKPRKASHPLRHILLIHFLGKGIEEFFCAGVPESRPFGRGPWPCLNPAVSHYRQAVILRCVITRNCETGEPVGHFYCSCGFSYARTGPDRERSDKFRRGKILEVGPVWEAELIRLAEKEGRSLRATARALGVDVRTVIRHLAHLADCRQEENFVEDGKSLIERRTRWLALIAKHPKKGRKELRTLGPADYCWLYRNDRGWLFKNLPPAKARKGSAGRRVDWPGRDHELAARIGHAAHAIRYAPGRPVRVTLSAIGKKLGALALLQRNIDKLPAARASLEGVIETRAAFGIRRVRAAERELLRRGKSLETWRIVREAHLRPGNPASVAAEIERIIYAFEKGVMHGYEI